MWEDYKAQTIAFYDAQAPQLAERYKQLLELHRRDEFPHFMGILPGKSVLDLGCGGGDHAAYFAEKGYRATGIDISAKMVELARSKGIDACVMDIEELTFANESFDGIWAVTSLPHVPKARMPPVVTKMHDILKPEGVLYVCVKEGTGEGLIADKEHPDLKRHFAFYQEDELLQLFAPQFERMPFRDAHMRVNDLVFLQYFFKKK